MNDPIIFDTPELWQQWLQQNHATSTGLWIQMAKKNTGVTTVTYEQALQEALCWGWIDGQVKRIDEVYYKQRFTPRRPKSLWSKLNVQRAERLIDEGRMQPAGFEAIEKAKADGRWDAAYDPGSQMTIPDDFLKELKKNKTAEAFFKTLNKTNLFSIGFRLQTSLNPSTRKKRIKEIIEMLEQGKRYH